MQKNLQLKGQGFFTQGVADAVSVAINGANTRRGDQQEPRMRAHPVLVKVVEAKAGGKYNGIIIDTEPSDNTTTITTNLDLSGLGVKDQVVLYNLSEDSSGATPGQKGLTADEVVPAIFVGQTDEGIPICACYAGGGGTLPVTVTVDGGSAGGSGGSCSFTYTVKNLAGISLGTTLSPVTGRIALVTYNTPSANSAGLGYYDASGAFKLYHVAQEFPLTDVDTVTFVTAVTCNGDGSITPTTASFTFTTLKT